MSIWMNHRSVIPLETSFRFTDGSQVSLKDLEGKTVFVNFWATTCGICMDDIPKLIKAYDELKHQGVEFIAISMPYDPPNRIMLVQQEFQISYPMSLDLDGHLNEVFGNVSVTPTHFLIADGKVISRKIGSINIESLKNEIESLKTQTSNI